MDELVKLLAGKLGVPEDKARMAAELTIGYLKKKLPAPLAGQIDNAIAGTDIVSKAKDLLKGLGRSA